MTQLRAVELARVRHRTYARIIDGVVGLVRTAVRSGAWVAVAYFFFQAVNVYAGTSTKFEAAVHAVVNIGADRWVAYIVALLSGIGFVHQRRLRISTIREQKDYIEKLERAVDPKRSTSRLTASGRPMKEVRDAD